MKKAAIWNMSLLLVLFANPLKADQFTGNYTTSNDYGQPINLSLKMEADGEVNGSLLSSGQQFVVETMSQGNRLQGVIYQDSASSMDESYLEAQLVNGQLQLSIMNLFADGSPDPNSRTNMVFTRDLSQSATTTNSLADVLGIGGSNSSSSKVIAQGQGGNLTEAGFNAYMDALAFCLQQIGDPTQIDQAARTQFRQNMINAFPGLPAETQQGLSNSVQIWDQYRTAWNGITLDQKKEFAFGVLSLAYGQQAAAQALGISQSGSSEGGSSSGSYDSYYTEGGAGGYGSYASDGECAYFSTEAGSISTCD